MRLNLDSLIYALPEDIDRAKKSGNFDELEKKLTERIANPKTTPMLRDRLIVEKELMGRWIRRYPYNHDEALKAIQKRVNGFTAEELDYYETQGSVDLIWWKGEKRYLSSFAGSLIKMNPEVKAREINPDTEDDGCDLNLFMKELKRDKEQAWRFTIKSSLKMDDEFFVPGKTYLMHMPVPAASAQQSAKEIVIKTDPDALIADENSFQRAVSVRRTLTENKPLNTEYTFVTRLKYVDPMNDKPFIAYPDALPPCEDDLSEQYPHIAFTPYLKALAKYIADGETNKVKLAKKIYDYITLNVRYSYMRSYILIDNHAEYAALNLKGDCGIQAILFITLCRILGIPARWQSGHTVDKFSTGDHDWAQFWTEEFGWLFADPSYGGGSHRVGNEERRNFYFGNLDPFRMVANRRYQTDYDVPKKYERFDPYDSQDGEVETEDQGFDCNAYDTTDTTVEFVKL